jgi:uncharacterized protein
MACAQNGSAVNRFARLRWDCYRPGNSLESTMIFSSFTSRRDFLGKLLIAGCGAGLHRAFSSRAAEMTQPGFPAAARVEGARFELRGRVREYLDNVTRQWLLVAPESNPAILEMFRDRDRLPLRDMVPWAGEFAGKYLVSAVQVWRLTSDDSLKKTIADFVPRLIQLQAEDGYLGPWPKESRLIGRAPNVGPKGGDTWDAWGHYHIMLGLLLWHEDTKDAAALNCARRMGDLFCDKFAAARLVDTGSTEMNLAPMHTLCLLYRRTGEDRYLKQALKICDEFAAQSPDGKPLAGDYLNAALAGKEFFQMPKPRWESLHPIMGLAELYHITGEEKYRRAFEQIWWSIVKLDRHNNGGFSSGEQAQGNPYHKGAIETCCTIAWIALSVEMLRLTGDPIVADELELSTLNSVLGMHSPNGRWVTYNTPMDGTRLASAHEIVFQARAGSPELNCCSVNGARGFGLISDWAVQLWNEAIFLNWYGPSKIEVRTPAGHALELLQETDYPRSDTVRLRVRPARRSEFALNLRIPHWSEKTVVLVNRKRIDQVEPGKYLTIRREWRRNDVIELRFDFSLRYWAGEREYAGKTSIYRGPLLLAYDRRFNAMDPDKVPSLNASGLFSREVESSEWIPPLLLMEFPASDGRFVRLCDFGSAGVGGSPYRSWLDVLGVKATEYSRKNPQRAGRAAA